MLFIDNLLNFLFLIHLHFLLDYFSPARTNDLLTTGVSDDNDDGFMIEYLSSDEIDEDIGCHNENNTLKQSSTSNKQQNKQNLTFYRFFSR